MPNEYLPLKVDAVRFADNAMRLHGNLPVKNMERLCPSLASDRGSIEVSLNFGVDEQGIRFLRGHLEANLGLQCQRCMESLDYGIIGDFLLGIVGTEEEARDLPGRFDPLIIKGVDLLISDVIEDELIVSLPIVPMHELQDCKVTLPLIVESETVSMKKENPFKVIELLRDKRDKK